MRLGLGPAVTASFWLLPHATAAPDDGRRTLSVEMPLVKRLAARNGIPPPTTDGRSLLSTGGGERPTFLNTHRRFHASGSGRPKEEEEQRSSASLKAEGGQVGDSSSPGVEPCDAAFLNCMPHAKCIECFATMQADDVDWATVKPETPCSDVVKFLAGAGKCTGLVSDQAEKDVFCNTFDNCVVWDDDDDDDGSGGSDSGGNGTDASGKGKIDCDSLTSCDWEGKHAAFIGDGVCHDSLHGCYNHEICKYDGGDCCEDTCEAPWDLVECGQDGYACRNPESKNCQKKLTAKCKKGGQGDPDGTPKPDPAAAACGADEASYRLVQYDSWGDGWDSTKMVIKDDGDKVIYEGGLKEGAEGTTYICLSTLAKCYHVEVSGGIWGNEVSWEVKPMSSGAPSIADGGTPMNCDFSVGGDACAKTCDGPPDKGHDNDPDYKSYQDLLTCLKGKCLIQVGACQDDPSCDPCLLDDTPGYCFANDNYNALIDCAMCRCTEEEDRPVEYCEQKDPAGSGPPKPPAPQDQHGVAEQCNADQTLKGSAAVMRFSQCSEIDTISAMVTEYDESNFGALDTFEACAHAYAKENMHGGKRALDCMRILSDAVKSPETDSKTDTPTEAVAALANHLYSNAETFCTCAANAAKDCPMCASFLHFKTLLSETLDSCQALDEIDCAAWSEFYDPCKTNLVAKFDKVDFTNSNQCDFVADSCGGAGPFPAFRRLDCGREISKQAWGFYDEYDKGCLGGTAPGPSPDPQPRPNPAPHDPPKATSAPTAAKPAAKPTKPAVAPTLKPYVPPPDDSDNVRPSPSSPSSSSSSPSKPKKKRHTFAWFLFICAVAGGVWYKRRQSESFDFVRYRRQRRNWGGESEMYTGLSMDNSCSFEPPTLPPTPSAMGGNVA